MGTELAEAVNAATAASVPQLIQKYIDPLILEYQRRYSPLLAAVPTTKIGTNRYNFVQRTRRPNGGAVTDGGARVPSNSVWSQPGFDIKLYQVISQVTGYAQAVTAGVVGDLFRAEMDGAMTSQMWSVETSMLYGNAAATAGITATAGPDMDGLDQFVNIYSGNTQNAIDAAEGTLGFSGAAGLDQLIEMVEANTAAAIGADYMFVASSKAVNKIGGLLQNQQRFVDKTMEVAAGLTVQTYRDIPLIKSSFLSARSLAVGTVTPSTATSGGTLAAATYFYRVAAVINRFGETAASAEVSQVAGGGSTSTVTLTFATPTDAESNEVILYKVFRSTGTGTEVLIGEVAGVDDLGNPVTSIVDTGSNLLVNGRAATGQAPWPTAYAGGNAGAKPRSGSDEDIYLIPRNRDFLVRPYVRDFFTKDLAQTVAAPDVLPFYIQNDTCLAVRGPKYVGRLARVAVVL